MTTGPAFALRPLERSSSNDGFDQGAFRVHISTKELKNLGLASGDVIRINTSKGFRGYAIAWPAQQTNPGNKPIAKATDILREKYDLTLTDTIFIERAEDDRTPIEFIQIVCSQSPQALSHYASEEELVYWIRHALTRLDIISPGCTFDVSRNGIRNIQRNSKFRATIEVVEPQDAEAHPHFFDPIKSQVTIVPNPAMEKSLARKDVTLIIDGQGIGGLSDHLATINKCLATMTSPNFPLLNKRLFGPTSFLIHGPEGSGKTLLLQRISKAPWQKVLKLDQKWLGANRKAQAEALCDDLFGAARANQPALILIDNLDKLLQKADETLVNSLQDELGKLEGTQVVVAAAARSVYDVDAGLRTSSTFSTILEILPPNVRQREDMFRQILGTDEQIPSVNFAALAERSHGFVGRDIRHLCGLAWRHHILSKESPLSDDVLGNTNFVTQEDFDAVVDVVQPTLLKDSILEVPKVRWTDIGGLDHARAQLEAIIVDPYKYPDLYAKFPGAQSRKGVLLYGPPGCAKTLIAQAVATESNQNFLAVKGSELIKMYVGESERGIRDVFRRARAAKPCIIFFDEIDSIGKSREKTQDSGLNVVTTLLNEMDGIERLKDVFIIGATNRPDILDSALIRPGRFDAHIHIGLPSEGARRQIFEIHTRKQPLAGDVDLDALALQTEGSSGADIKGLCDEAVQMAISDCTASPERRPEIRMCHFERALEEHVPHTAREEAARYEGWRPGKSLSAD